MLDLFGADISCTKQPRKFLCFHWLAPHQSARLHNLKVWGLKEWHKYELDITCDDCGVTSHVFGTEEALIVRLGLDPKTAV